MSARLSLRTVLVAAAWLGLTLPIGHTAQQPWNIFADATLGTSAANAATLPPADTAPPHPELSAIPPALNATSPRNTVPPHNGTLATNATSLKDTVSPRNATLAANATSPDGAQGTPGQTAPSANATITPEIPAQVTTPADAPRPANAARSMNGTAPAGQPPASNATVRHELDPAWLPLFARLEADGFSREKMEALFARLGPGSYSPAFMGAKVAELRGVYGLGIRPLPYEIDLTPEGYVQPLPDTTAQQCRAFLTAHTEDLAAIRKQYGVPPDIIMGILLVETGLGMNLGQTSALRALGSMASTTTPALLGSNGNAAQARKVPPAVLAGILKSKSEWAYTELKALIRYGERYGYPSAGLPGSVYGAIGLCQFMPSNIDLFGVDGDQDGKIDLFSVPDALHSVAHYLESSGWRGAQTPERKIAVIRQYNDDDVYAHMVLAVANQVARVAGGKVKDGVNLLGAAYPMSGRYIDPSLRRFRGRVPVAARVKSLGDYSSILNGGE